LPALALALLALLFTSVVAAAQGLPAGSRWENQRGSYLFVDASGADGSFSGRFWNRAPGYGCHDTFAAAGRVIGNRVRFVVDFRNAVMDCRTVTVWTGTVRGRVLSTKWRLVYRPRPPAPPQILSGTDEFQRR